MATEFDHHDHAAWERAFRGALERISLILKMPGSPDLIKDVPKAVQRQADYVNFLQASLEPWREEFAQTQAMKVVLRKREPVEQLLIASDRLAKQVEISCRRLMANDKALRDVLLQYQMTAQMIAAERDRDE